MKLKLYHHFITIMKRLFFLITLLSVFELGLSAQNAGRAKQILDQTSAVLSNKGGASAQFTITTPGVGTTTGQITIKGNKFTATTPKAAIWYDGKTQWTYMSKTEEVNVSNPDESQQAQMNPYKFITDMRYTSLPSTAVAASRRCSLPSTRVTYPPTCV